MRLLQYPMKHFQPYRNPEYFGFGCKRRVDNDSVVDIIRYRRIFADRYIVLNKVLKEDHSFMESIKSHIHKGDLEAPECLLVTTPSSVK